MKIIVRQILVIYEVSERKFYLGYSELILIYFCNNFDTENLTLLMCLRDVLKSLI